MHQSWLKFITLRDLVIFFPLCVVCLGSDRNPYIHAEIK